jgi:hypothetical protein
VNTILRVEAEDVRSMITPPGEVLFSPLYLQLAINTVPKSERKIRPDKVANFIHFLDKNVCTDLGKGGTIFPGK